MRRFVPIATVLVTALFAVAGCGDEEDPEPVASTTEAGATGATGESGPLSKSEYIDAADAICEEAESSEVEQLTDLFPNVQGPEDLSEADFEQLANEVVVPSLRSQLEQLRALSPPEGDEDQIDEILSRLEEGVSEIEDDPQLLAGEGGSALQDASQLARDYGLSECGS